MSAEIIGTLSGSGKVLRGTDVVSVVEYDLTFYQEFLDSSTLTGPGRIPGKKRIEGTIRGASLPIGQQLKLVTAAGDTFEFFVTDGYGSIAPSGPFLNSRGEPVF